MIKSVELRRKWENNKARRLNLINRPEVDAPNGRLSPEEDRTENIKKRFKHLSKVLVLLHSIYRENKPLYGDKFLAFVGNSVIRQWPWIDFPFVSKDAQKRIEKIDQDAKILGLLQTDISNNKIKEGLKELQYEHWTPISFFRDIFDLDDDLTENDFYEILTHYYRVVWITKEENDKLDKKHRATRSVSCYEDHGIEIEDKQNLWDCLKDDVKSCTAD